MSNWYSKTDAGRAEIKSRLLKLSRPARNLLLIIDERNSGENWVQLVHGATSAELQSLVDLGLIELQKPRNDAPSPPRRSTAASALSALSYDQLYDLLTSQARDRLGLLRGYSFVLEIECCKDRDELVQLALKFMKLVERHQGPVVAQGMWLALGVSAQPT